MSDRLQRILPLSALGTLLLVLVGCAEPTGTVSGKVTYKGNAVTNGAIAFHMQSKGIAQNAKLDATGKFTMASPLPTGAYKVYYVAPTVEPQDPRKTTPPPEVKTIMPQKFQDLQGSNLTVEVKPGVNDFPIDFKD